MPIKIINVSVNVVPFQRQINEIKFQYIGRLSVMGDCPFEHFENELGKQTYSGIFLEKEQG